MWRLAYISPLVMGLLFGSVNTSVPEYPDTRVEVIVQEDDKPSTVRDQAKLWMLQRIHLEEWQCMDKIIHAESRWIPNLWNSQGSSAYGLGQVKGSHKYTADKPMKQFKVAVKYVIARYGTPCKGWSFHQKMGWY
jgi:hypothetical protein